MSVTTDRDLVFTVHPMAAETIGAMREHANALGRNYGERSEEYVAALQSLAQQLANMMAHPMSADTRVTRDGPLSLYVASGIHYGIIWHGRGRRCTTDGCPANLKDDGTAWVYSSDRPALEHEHTPSFPYDAPEPGTWSFHS